MQRGTPDSYPVTVGVYSSVHKAEPLASTQSLAARKALLQGRQKLGRNCRSGSAEGASRRRMLRGDSCRRKASAGQPYFSGKVPGRSLPRSCNSAMIFCQFFRRPLGGVAEYPYSWMPHTILEPDYLRFSSMGAITEPTVATRVRIPMMTPRSNTTSRSHLEQKRMISSRTCL